ncbi:hypothetical protein C8J56DRAFT_929479, partial [Mycena floridula]
MSLLKIPFLASVLWGINFSMTSPNPPPKPEESLKPTGTEIIAPRFPVLAKSIFWILPLCEMAVIVACNWPDFRYSDRVLGALVGTDLNPATTIRITAPFLLGWSLNLVGTHIRRHCYNMLGRFFTFELSIRKKHQLITSGPYAYCRHPSYSGAILSGVGAVLSHLSPGAWFLECSGLISNSPAFLATIWIFGTAIIFLALVPRMRKEDALLKKEFGKEWDDWAKAVPYRMFPGIY